MPGARAVEPKAEVAVETREVEAGAETAGMTEYHIARARAHAVRLRCAGADNEIGEAITVDIAGAADRYAAAVIARQAVKTKAIAGGEITERQAGTERVITAENDVARAGQRAAGRTRCTNQHIVDAVAVDVTCGADRGASQIQARDARDAQAIGAAQAAEIDAGRKRARRTEYDVYRARAVAGRA